MIELRLDDPNFAENAKAVLSIRRSGLLSDADIQKMYDAQVDKDAERALKEGADHE